MDRAVTLDEINSSNPRHLSSDSLLAHDLVNADGHCPTDPLGVSGNFNDYITRKDQCCNFIMFVYVRIMQRDSLTTTWLSYAIMFYKVLEKSKLLDFRKCVFLLVVFSLTLLYLDKSKT